MKKLILSAIMLSLAFQTMAAGENWLTNHDAAVAKAKKENKLVLMDFTGSDWCPPCKALHRDVFDKQEFTKIAKEKFVLLEVDFPRRKKQNAEQKKANAALAKKHKIRGYPTVIVLNAKGEKVFENVGYGGDAEKYIAKLKALKP